MQNRTLLLGLTLAIALLPSDVAAAALPLLRAEWTASAATAGAVFSAYQAGYVASVLVLLPLTDRIPASRIIFGCAIATSVAFVLFPLLAYNAVSAALLRFLAGLGLSGIYLPGVRVVAANAPPARRGFAVAAYVSAFYLGSAMSLWLSGFLMPSLGWRGAALALGVASLAIIPLAKVSTDGIALPDGQRAHLDVTVLKHRPLLWNILAYAGHTWELYIFRAWMAAYLASVVGATGLAMQAAASVGSQWAALMGLFGVPGVWFGGWLSDRVGRARAALVFALCSGAISLAIGSLQTAPWLTLILVGCAYGLLVSSDSPVYSTAVTELAPAGRLGSAQALQAFIGFGATIFSPAVAGAALDLGFGWAGVFAVAGIVGILFALPLIRLVRDRSAVPAGGG
ncbi:MAG: MFS transporter [Armatimonadetes bacterium]|nr:MFS transporter [Armatimonadota bacterium]